jgi:hypothetical protein
VSVGSFYGNPSPFVDNSRGIPTSFMGHPVPCGQLQGDSHLLHGTPSFLWTSPMGIPISFMGHPVPCGHVQKGSPSPSCSLWTCPKGVPTPYWDTHVSVGSPHGNPSLVVDMSNGNPHLLHGTPSSLWTSPTGPPHTGTPDKSNGDLHFHGALIDCQTINEE